MPLEKAIDYERDLQTICFATEDAAEGRAAFKEKRPPRSAGSELRACPLTDCSLAQGGASMRCPYAVLGQTRD